MSGFRNGRQRCLGHCIWAALFFQQEGGGNGKRPRKVVAWKNCCGDPDLDDGRLWGSRKIKSILVIDFPVLVL